MIASPNEWYNLLELDEEKFRAIVALGVGCDVLPSGIKGVGIDTLAKWVEIHGKKYDCFIEEYIKKLKYQALCWMSIWMQSYLNQEITLVMAVILNLSFHVLQYWEIIVPIMML